MNAKELNKKVGDSLVLLNDGKEINMTVSGIYQDITNGGRTAKARMPFDPKTVLWYVVAMDVKPDIRSARRWINTRIHFILLK